MAIVFSEDQVTFEDVVGVEEAEELLGWLQAHPGASFDLSRCTHIHPANVQIMLAMQVVPTVWPTDSGLATWLSALSPPPARFT